MLQSDLKIIEVLRKARANEDPTSENSLLSKFEIKPFDKTVKTKANAIFVGIVNSELDKPTMTDLLYKDLIEVYVKTTIVDRDKSIEVIRVVMNYIMEILLEDNDLKGNIVVKNVTPSQNDNYIYTTGHMLVQVKSVYYTKVEESELSKVCKILSTVETEGD
jgi:hypothetical protein